MFRDWVTFDDLPGSFANLAQVLNRVHLIDVILRSRKHLPDLLFQIDESALWQYPKEVLVDRIETC